MKEIHYFFAPDAEITEELPDEEARHAAKVLRLNRGDEIVLIDGKGLFHKAKVVEISPRSCRYSIYESERSLPTWSGRIHLAVAPTKNMERVEWLGRKSRRNRLRRVVFRLLPLFRKADIEARPHRKNTCIGCQAEP